jgi:hypothetical protein
MASCERTKIATSSSSAAAAASAPSASASDTRVAGQEGQELSGSVANTSAVDRISISCFTNAQYHAAREAFLDTVHRWFMFGVVALGAAALIDIFPEEKKSWLRALCSAGAALLAALDLTFDLSNRARMHSLMKRRYFELLADVREEKKTPDEARVCIERYSCDEEPQYRILYLLCWNNALSSVYGDKAERFEIPRWALMTKNFFRRSGANYPVK